MILKRWCVFLCPFSCARVCVCLCVCIPASFNNYYVIESTIVLELVKIRQMIGKPYFLRNTYFNWNRLHHLSPSLSSHQAFQLSFLQYLPLPPSYFESLRDISTGTPLILSVKFSIPFIFFPHCQCPLYFSDAHLW